MKRFVLCVLIALIALPVSVPASPLSASSDTSLEGELVLVQLDDGSHRMVATLHSTSGDISLDPSVLPATARTGDRVRVTTDGGRTRVRTLSQVKKSAVTPGVRKLLFVLVSTPTTPAQYTAADVNALLPQIDAYYSEISAGTVRITGEVRTLQVSSMRCSTSTGSPSEESALGNLSAYQHVVYVQNIECPMAGQATLGGTNVGLFRNALTSRVLIHELGHNLGLSHAGSVACDESGSVVSLASGFKEQCSTEEYGDRFDSMGAYDPARFSAPRLFDLGFLKPDQVHVRPQGDIALAPLGTLGAKTTAMISDTTGGQLWLEYRTASPTDGIRIVTPQLQARYVPPRKWLLPSTSFLIDLTPGSRGATTRASALTTSMDDAGLSTVGSAITFGNGVKITLSGLDATSARINVTGGIVGVANERVGAVELSGLYPTVDADFGVVPLASVLGLQHYLVQVLSSTGQVLFETTSTTSNVSFLSSNNVSFTLRNVGSHTLRITPVFLSGLGQATDVPLVITKNGFATGGTKALLKAPVIEYTPGLVRVTVGPDPKVERYQVITESTQTSTEKIVDGSGTVEEVVPTNERISVTVYATLLGTDKELLVLTKDFSPPTPGPRIAMRTVGQKIRVTARVPSALRKSCTASRCTAAIAKTQVLKKKRWVTVVSTRIPSSGRFSVLVPRSGTSGIRVVVGRTKSDVLTPKTR